MTTIADLIQARASDRRTAERWRMCDRDAIWRKDMMPYQVRDLERHDEEVAATAQRLRQEQ